MALDVAFLAGKAAEMLAPALPVLLHKVTGEAATDVVKRIGDEGWRMVQSLWTTLQPKVSADPAAQQVLSRVAEQPGAERPKAALAFAVEGFLETDETLRQEIARLIQQAERTSLSVTASGDRAVAIGGNVSGASIVTGDRNRVQNNQVRDIIGSQGVVVGSGSARTTSISEFDAAAVFQTLMELQAALGASQLEPRTRLVAQTKAGEAALAADADSGEVDSNTVANKVKQIGATLQEANVLVEEGSSLWEKIQNVASVLGPVVGGAQTVLGWFNIS